MMCSTGFSSAKRTRPLNVISRFSSVSADRAWHYPSGVSNLICVKTNKDVEVYGVRLFGNANAVELKVMERSGFVLGTKGGRFVSKHVHSEIGDYQGFDVVFERPIVLKANSGYVRFEAKISDPSSCYGKSGQSRIEHSGVMFFFDSSFGFRTSVESGQFSEFLFSLV